MCLSVCTPQMGHWGPLQGQGLQLQRHLQTAQLGFWCTITIRQDKSLTCGKIFANMFRCPGGWTVTSFTQVQVRSRTFKAVQSSLKHYHCH